MEIYLAKSTMVGREFRKIDGVDEINTLQVSGKNNFTLERIRRNTAKV